MVNERPNIGGYRLLTFTGTNGVLGTKEFDSNLILNKKILIKDIKFKWYLIDASEGLPYKSSITNIDGLVSGHEILNVGANKVFIPENFASNIFQNGNCLLNFSVNNKPVFLNGKMDDLYLHKDNLDILINESVQSFDIKITGAAMLLLLDNVIASSNNIGWVCEVGVFII